jgi:hypothetical protein
MRNVSLQDLTPFVGTYTRTDGTTGTTAASAQMADVDLREDTFYSNFTDPVTLTPESADSSTGTDLQERSPMRTHAYRRRSMTQRGTGDRSRPVPKFLLDTFEHRTGRWRRHNKKEHWPGWEAGG